MALNVVLLQIALRLDLRGKLTLRRHRQSVVRDPIADIAPHVGLAAAC
jgi:hypothetical protein